MIIKILPAGDLIPYLKGRFDSMGNEREVAAEILHEIRAFPDDHDSITTRLLQAQAAAGLRSRLKGAKKLSVPSRLRKRRDTEWVRHSQAHLVHLINCFHERRDLVAPHLPAVVRATEDLLLAGLPRDALHFTWYKHDQKIAPHTHGGLMRILLLSGQPYKPELDSGLCLTFNRLVSRFYNWQDPLDPQAIRLVQAGPGSWKTANKRLIRKVCQTATQKWEQNKSFGYLQFIGHLKRPRFGLTILAQPDKQENQILPEQIAAELRGRVYKNTVVVLRRQKPGKKPVIISFSGPMCHPNFASPKYERLRDSRHVAVRALRTDPTAEMDLYEKFADLLQKRYAEQNKLCNDPKADPVSLADFHWLNPASDNWKAQMARHAEAAKNGEEQAEAIDLSSPDSNWGDYDYPFVSNATPEITDITDPLRSPLREAIKEANWALQVEEDAFEVPETTVSDEVQTTTVVQSPVVDQKSPQSAAPPPTTDHVNEAPVVSLIEPGPTLSEEAETEAIGIPALDGTPAAPQSAVENVGKADSPILPDAPIPKLDPAKLKATEPPPGYWASAENSCGGINDADSAPKCTERK